MRNKRKFSASQPEQEGWRVFSTPHTHTHTHIYSYTHLSPCFADTHDVTQRKQRTPFGQVMVQDRKLRWSITDHLPTNPFQDKRIHCFTVPSSRLTHTHTHHTLHTRTQHTLQIKLRKLRHTYRLRTYRIAPGHATGEDAYGMYLVVVINVHLSDYFEV
jgi:hypothetical protein